ncbi:hypothetical protein FACS1894166_04240 [Bacilli bacterium]|nr:hypothetical protein FACS1894166_04240 [Bacilli bacterium]
MLQFAIMDKKKILNKKINVNFHKIARILSSKCEQIFDVSIVNDHVIKNINKRYRKIDKVTDVISFAFNDSMKTVHSVLIGEIFINYQQATRQAKAYGFTKEREITFLFLHGLLHLLGFDHTKPWAEKKMIAMQNKIMKQLKL